MKKKLLILGLDHDIHADAVQDKIEKLGYSTYRLDPETDWTPSKVRSDDYEWLPSGCLNWSISENTYSSSLKWHDQKINFEEIGAVFCRNFHFAEPADNAPVETHLKYAEMSAGLNGILRALDDCFWINRPWLEDPVDYKMLQLKAARRFGLEIPSTLVTNDENSARKFISNCHDGTIIKQLSEIGLIDGEPTQEEVHGFYTSLITDEMLCSLGDVTHAPCLFQESIEKKADIRAMVVGDKIFSYLIDSQSRLESRTDFRTEPKLPSEVFELPAITAKALLNMVKSWGLEFAACDFALTPADKLIFFEANVTGNWLWLESSENHPVLDGLVDLLSSKLEQ